MNGTKMAAGSENCDAPATKNTAAVALGKLGGLSTSEAKREAARRNGAKGGRPRKQAPPAEPETKPDGGSLTEK